ncbi:MAG: c-type cytochrome biogenesis protein CcmI [Rudaea sp.]|nr:c-type cytochrome biogenesis protein CcmI [Rudaea sp.]
MIAFVIFAAIMLAAALAFVLPTLLRGRGSDPAALAQRQLKALKQAHASGILNDSEYATKRTALGEQVLGAIDTPTQAPRSGYFVALAIALLLPASAIVLYRVVGEPRAVDPAAASAAGAQAPADHSQDMQQAITKLAEKLKQNPNDVEGWTLLGRAYEATERFADARDALKHAYDLSPDDPDVTVAYAEALALAGESRRLDGEPRVLLEKALKTAPDNQRGLWLIGIGDYQAKKYDSAIATWKRLLTVLPKGSDVVQSVQHQIATAEAARDGRAPPEDEETAGNEAAETAPAAATATATPAAGDAAGPHLTVNVTLDPKLRDKLAPGDVLFIYAKAANGPPMPLAIQRMQASKLPTTVVLTDGMGMLPTMKLSQFPQVVIGARVSRSGNAIAQSGDLQTLSKPMDVNSTAPVALTIDQVVP